MAHTNQDLFPNTNKESGLFPNLPSANQPHSYGDDHRQPSATKGVKKNGSSSTTVLHSTKNPIQLPKAKVNVSAKSQGVNPSGGLFPGLSNQNPRGGLFPSLSYQNPSEGLFPGLSNKNQPHSYGDDHRQPSTTKGVKKNGSSSTTVLHDTGKPDWYGAAKTEKNAQQKAAGAQRRGGKKSASVTTGGTQEQGQGSDSGSQTNNNGGSNQSSQDDNNSQTARGVKKNSKDNNKNKDESRVGALHKYDPNGNNLLARFTKVYGPDAPEKYKEAVSAFKAADGEIKETYQAGQYGYSVMIKVNGEWTSDVDVITGKLAQHASASGALSITNPDTPENALKLTRANLTTTTGGGTESGLTRRFTLAYGNGNVGTGNQILKDTVAAYKVANPGKIRIMGPNGEETQLGQPGAYVQVMYKGEWNSNTDIVSQTLAGSVSIDGAAAVPFEKLRPDQQAYLGGASGSNVLKQLNLALGSTSTADTTLLQKAIEQFRAQNPDGIKLHGEIGQPGFWIEVKTDSGWTSGTNAVVRRLHKATTSSGVADGVKKDDRGSLGATASPKNQKRSDKNTKTSTADISISQAAQTSKAMLGADVDSSRSLSKKELNPYKPADRNNNGVVSKKEIRTYVSAANTDGVAGISKAEAQVFKLKDINNDGKTGKLEKKAYKELAGKDGEISKKEAKEVRQALKGQISTKQEKTTYAMANDYLKKASNKKAGGTQRDDDVNGALAGGAGQIAKPKKKDDDGPRGKNKKNKN